MKILIFYAGSVFGAVLGFVIAALLQAGGDDDG